MWELGVVSGFDLVCEVVLASVLDDGMVGEGFDDLHFGDALLGDFDAAGDGVGVEVERDVVPEGERLVGGGGGVEVVAGAGEGEGGGELALQDFVGEAQRAEGAAGEHGGK